MAYIYNRFAKWVENIWSGTKKAWWKTNFNMPVPDLWDSFATWNEWSWPFYYHWEATSFDLTGFRNWWECLVGISWLHRDAADNFTWQSHLFIQRWEKPNWDLMFESWAWINLNSTQTWRETQLGSNQWVAPWEIDWNGIYKLIVSISWPEWNTSTTYNYTITNHPWFSWYKVPGYIWVEWDNLNYIDANWFEWSINWIQLDYRWQSNAWFIWTNDSISSPYMYYIDDQWYQRLHPWNLEQVASTWFNWPTWSVSWATPWYIWMDDEYWYTHIAHIWWDWKKYIIWDWVYPYTNPT